MARWLVALVCVSSCVGPEAPDVALCRDVVTRLCLGPVCEAVTERLVVAPERCEPTLLERTGCGAESFAFTTPSRARVLECRVPLLRLGASLAVKPACQDVADVLSDCPDVARFLGARP